MEKKFFFDFTGCEAPSKLGFDRIPCSSNNILFHLFILLKQKRTQKFSGEFICYYFEIMLKNQLLCYNFAIDRNIFKNTSGNVILLNGIHYRSTSL